MLTSINLYSSTTRVSTMSKANERKYQVGTVHQSIAWGEYKVIGAVNLANIKIKFTKTGYTAMYSVTELERSDVKDKLYPSIHNRGYIGIGNFKATVNRKTTRHYQRWAYLICSDKQICDEWLNFQTFARWFEDRFQDKFIGRREIKDRVIDGYRTTVKLKKGVSIYSPENCNLVVTKKKVVKK